MANHSFPVAGLWRNYLNSRNRATRGCLLHRITILFKANFGWTIRFAA
jgi:hypothetical protein